MAISSPHRLSKPDVLASMSKSLDDFLAFLAVEKGASANTVLAYRNDLRQLAVFIGTRPGTSGWRSLDMSNLNLDPRSPYVRCLGKGAKERTIPFHDQALEALMGYLEEGRPLLV